MSNWWRGSAPCRWHVAAGRRPTFKLLQVIKRSSLCATCSWWTLAGSLRDQLLTAAAAWRSSHVNKITTRFLTFFLCVTSCLRRKVGCIVCDSQRVLLPVYDLDWWTQTVQVQRCMKWYLLLSLLSLWWTHRHSCLATRSVAGAASRDIFICKCSAYNFTRWIFKDWGEDEPLPRCAHLHSQEIRMCS